MVAKKFAKIRRSRPEDMRTILSIEHKCFPDPYPLSLLNRLYEMYPDAFLVAEVDGKVVGYVIAAIRWEKTGHILAIAVDPSHQRRRIGSVLMLNVINRLRDKGAKCVRLEVRKSNVTAQQFYLKLGFRPREEIPYYYEDGETAIAMEYEIGS